MPPGLLPEDYQVTHLLNIAPNLDGMVTRAHLERSRIMSPHGKRVHIVCAMHTCVLYVMNVKYFAIGLLVQVVTLYWKAKYSVRMIII